MREAPALARVSELAGLLESLGVVDEALLGLPGELVNLPAEERRPFGEVEALHVRLLEDAPGL